MHGVGSQQTQKAIAMIELQPEKMIGKGLHRECYVHPDDDSRCIKVVVNRGVEETRREQAYYKLLQKQGIDWQMLPKFYGNVSTTKGQGAVFDLVRDSDGHVAKTLEYYFQSTELTEQNQQGLAKAIALLKQYLLTQNIIVMTLKPKNIVYQRQSDDEGQAIIIDNIGNSDVIPISSYCRYFGRKKIERKWNRFIALVRRDYPDNPVLQVLLNQI